MVTANVRSPASDTVSGADRHTIPVCFRPDTLHTKMNAVGKHTQFVSVSRVHLYGKQEVSAPFPYDWLPAAGMLTPTLRFSFCCFTGFFFTGLMACMAISKKIADSAS